MKETTHRTKEQIFSDMHRELRKWNSDIPESPDRMDPILRITLQLYANQLSSIDKKIERIWEVASDSLIKSVCPESRRYPVPAFTVMRCVPNDPVVEIDPHTKFYYKEEREGGETFFFAPVRDEKIISAEIVHIIMQSGEILFDLSPRPETEKSTTTTGVQTTMPSGSENYLYLAFRHDGPAADFKDGAAFIRAKKEAVKQIRWAKWYPGGEDGTINQNAGFCPGMICSIEKMYTVDDKAVDWGGLRKSVNLFQPLEDNFIQFSDNFLSSWKKGKPNSQLSALAKEKGIELSTENLFWIKLKLPEGGDKSRLQAGFDILFDTFIAINKSDLTLFKHTGGNRLIEIEIPEDIEHVLEINEVTDSDKNIYAPRHEAISDAERKFYSVEERNGKLVLWFDYTSGIEAAPDSITVNYSTTSGTNANGIEAGKISELYESHPGISEVQNISSVTGAVPAKTSEQIMAEVSQRLRNRDRALNFDEIARWAETFDPRIIKAECASGIDRFENGVRRCIVVEAAIQYDQFYAQDEILLLKSRLISFLKSRSPVNTQYRVDIIKK